MIGNVCTQSKEAQACCELQQQIPQNSPFEQTHRRVTEQAL
jgi:hypothetical protein